MSGSKLDQIVKGAPPPGTSVPAVVSRTPSPSPFEPSESRSTRPGTPALTQDPLAALPSSPPQIYLNLLILEASLRSQYLTLRDRRRQNTFFLFLLSLWIAGFTYLLFLRPREDGSGVGGSVYWVVETGEKVALMGGVVTGILIWGTGQWDRGMRWPRRWVSVANRGMRNINAKIVVVEGPWWKELLGLLVFLFPYSALFPSSESSFSYTELSTQKHGPEYEPEMLKDEDLSPGGDYIKLLLLPKPFSPDFRENWELYRLEYWEKENERRTKLRQVVRKREKELAKKEAGWLWWTGWRRRRKPSDAVSRGDIEKTHQKHLQLQDGKRIHSSARSESHSRETSRSSTPSTLGAEDRAPPQRPRRGSTTGSASERRRMAKSKASGSSESGPVPKMTPISRPA